MISRKNIYTVRSTVKSFYTIAQIFSVISTLLKIIIIIGGLSAFNEFGDFRGILLLFFAAIAEIIGWKSSNSKSSAIILQGHADMQESLGWLIPNSILDKYCGIKEYEKYHKNEKYFDNDETPSPLSAVKKLEESSWWSSKLTAGLTKCYFYLIVLMVFTVVFWPLYIISTSTDLNLVKINAEVVSLTLTVLWTCGLLRKYAEYREFSDIAKNVYLECSSLIATKDVSELDAIKLWHHYQLARTHAPLIFNFYYIIKRKELNQLWQIFKEVPNI